MVKISVETMLVLVPWRTSAILVRVIACELPGPSVCVQYPLVVRAAFDPPKKRGSYDEAGKIDHRGRVPPRYWHDDVNGFG